MTCKQNRFCIGLSDNGTTDTEHTTLGSNEEEWQVGSISGLNLQ